MTRGKPSVLPLIAMTMVYLLCALAAYGYLHMSLMFGSEIHREQGIPLAEWAVITAPLLVTITMLSATIVFWNKGLRRVSYGLFTAMMIAVLALFTLFEAPTI